MNKRTLALILLLALTLTGCANSKPAWLDVVNHNLTSTGYPAVNNAAASQILANICEQNAQGVKAADIFRSDLHTEAETAAVLVMVNFAIENECSH